VRDAEAELAGAADEGVTWRLREAFEASHAAAARPLAAAPDSGDDDARLSAALQELIDRQIWKKS
jgi:DNA primase